MNVIRTLRLALSMALLTAVSAVSFAAPAASPAPAGDAKIVALGGKVFDDSGVPVVGAMIYVTDNTAYSTMTEADGSFTMDAPAGAPVAVACIGYVNYSFNASAKTNYRITLQSDMQNLEESVVVGYGTQKKANLTGAISNVSNKAIAATTATGIVNKLQGKVSGLNIRNQTGTPGDFDSSINVRGFGAPLYIIDGINRTSADFNRLNSEDVESISVLKDASAAIYGLNAANGVIIVTTKSGTKTGKAHFQFNANVGLSSPTSRVRMANAYEYYYLRNAANINMGTTEYISAAELEKWRTGEYQSTDWYNETFKKNSVRQEYSISANGGNEKVQYYFNVNYINDQGLFKSGDLVYDKWSFRSRITANLTESLKASVNVTGYADKQLSPNESFINIFRGTCNILPYRTVYANNNPKYYNDVRDANSFNPVALSHADASGHLSRENTAIQTTFDLAWNPTFCRDLTIKGTVAYDKRFNRTKSTTTDWVMYTYDPASDTYTGSHKQEIPNISQSYSNNRYITTQLQADYKHLWKDAHNFSAQFIWETRSQDGDSNSIYKNFDLYTNDEIDYAADNDKTKTSGNISQARNMSFIGRLNYDYKGRYLIEVAARYDGSYRYAPEVRWGLFPVVSAGWRISEEKWMKSATWLSNLKIRGSFGQIGEDTGTAFQYIEGFTTGGGWWAFTDQAGVFTEGVSTPAITNRTMTWTRSNISDLGIDFNVLDNRLSFTFDVFRKDKTGILANRSVTIPNTFGASFPQENLNSNRVQGLEFSLGWQDRIGEFFYSLSGNCTYSRQMNMYIEGAKPSNSWNNYRSHNEYRWNDLAWGYKIVGQFQTQEEIDNWPVYSTSTGMQYVCPGDWKYEDTNGDGVIDGDDQRPILLSSGANPKWNYGFTIAGSWRGLDFNILLQGAAGFMTHYSSNYSEPFWEEGNLPAWYMDAWHHEDPYDASTPWIPGALPAIRTLDGSPYLNGMPSIQSFIDCSYLRIKNIEIGYTIPNRIMSKAHLDKLRIFANCSNPVTFSGKYAKAFDPEVIAGTYSAGWIYPLTRIINFGLNLSF
ncbi:MAG: TonB-dependent receptor [Bacteroidales bacterium]|nr:TonB-dependent receptor [Bacteroidales bacterium]